MDDLERMALESAKVFGGSTSQQHMHIVAGLERRGLVQIVSREPVDGWYNYVLTEVGRKALRNDL